MISTSFFHVYVGKDMGFVNLLARTPYFNIEVIINLVCRGSILYYRYNALLVVKHFLKKMPGKLIAERREIY